MSKKKIAGIVVAVLVLVGIGVVTYQRAQGVYPKVLAGPGTRDNQP